VGQFFYYKNVIAGLSGWGSLMLSVGPGVGKQAATRWAETARGESGRYASFTNGKRLSIECGTKSKMPGVVGVLG
jgi:hypothetical protein